MPHIFCRASFLAALLAVAPAFAQDYNGAAEEILSEYFSNEGPGAAVAVLQNGEVLVETAIGYADVDAEIAMDSRSVFDLASVSKQFTGAAVLALAKDGRLDVRQPIRNYLPDFVDSDQGRAVRVSDLLYHISGLPDYTSDDWEGTDGQFARLTTESHLRWMNETEANELPGEVHLYNNSGYVLLALIVERVSGQRFADFVRTRLFGPAGMRTARVMDRLDQRFPRQVKGYESDDDGDFSPSSSPSSVTGDGNVFASLSDMIAWMRALDGNRVLDGAQKRAAWRNGKLDSGEPIDDEGSGYGYGWVIEEDGRLSHSGSWMGTSTYVLRDAESGVNVVVLSNDESADVESIAEALRALTD
jgi:CubicO group peptidase (beta-lactamase class C family)